MSHLSPRPSRRELFAGWLRYGTLGVVMTAGVWTAAKRRRLVREGVCISDGMCRGCVVLTQCALPQASLAREFIEKGTDGQAK